MKHRFNVLDIFRGIFASFVVFFHMSHFAETPILNNSFINNADMFVDFFFVLSGFVVCYSYMSIDSTKQYTSFLKKRFKRLYPLHLTLLLLFAIVEIIKLGFQHHIQINNSLQNTPLTFVTSLFLINSIKWPGVTNYSWNGVSWSISAELFSYIFFASFCFLLTKYSRLKPFVYLTISVLSLFILAKITQSYKLNFGFDYGFLRGIIGFFIGTVCFYCFNFFYEKLKSFNNTIYTILETLMIILVIYFVTNGVLYKKFGFIYEIIFFASIFIFAFEKGIISKLLVRSTFLKNTGKYSYSIYMIHSLLISIFNVIFIRIFKFPPSAYWYLFIINYIVIYLASSWTYKNIEMRFQQQKTNVKS